MVKGKALVFDKRNYILLLGSLAVLATGFILMTLDQEPYGFGLLGLTVGPAVVLLGLILPFFSIFPRKKSKPAIRNAFDKLNRWIGWGIFAGALLVFVLTLEPTTSFWDCGEFIASAYKLQVPHPPGAPLFLLVGRLFSLLALGDVTQVAYWINMVSALASAFTILFLFWSITLLARKIVLPPNQTPTLTQSFLILASGAVGALSFTFSDSFWFSAVEAEVYAFSSFFTALVVWAMLQWERTSDPIKGNRWLILIAYLMGLSIGVHLLNLCAIPAMALIYYHRYYKYSFKGAFLTLVLSLGLIGLIMWGIIPGLPALAGSFEIFFVNTMGLPFGGGIIIFLLLFIAAIVYSLRKAGHYQKPLFQTLLLSFVYILVGYSVYLIVPIRSGHNPLIDENNPEDIISFVSYLRREQYEQRPLFYGPQHAAELIDQQEGKAKYARVKNRYEVVDHAIEPIYDPKGMSLLPRLYSSTPSHLQEYKKWVNVREGEKPAFSQNLAFLFQYQLGHMYGRYFLWNFVGRDSDVQNAGVLWPWESNQNLPYEVAINKARNNYWLLPLLLGITGGFYHFRKSKQDAWVVVLLFLFTGLAIAFFLNQPPLEPRERDYAYAGSFYAFAIWIGVGTLAVAEYLAKIIRHHTLRAGAAFALSLAVPAIMAVQGWDDHDRSGRYYAADFARNMLQSCAPNAILFTNGDNDTFPLWYAQEVEGLRRDVRVIVLPYLNTDWYIAQMKRPAYESAPLPISMKKENFQFGQNNYLPYVARPQVASGMDVQQFISLVKQNHEALQVTAQDGRHFLSVPTKNFYLDINRETVLQSGQVPKERAADIVNQMRWQITGSGMEKKHLVISDIMATNNWQRPIYFSTTVNTEDLLNLNPYLQLEGLAYRVLPLKNPDPEADAYVVRDLMKQNLLQKFKFRNLQDPHIYYDNVYQSQIVPNMRRRFALLAESYLQDGDIKQAREVLSYALQKLPDAALPYDYFSPLYVALLVKTGDINQANQLLNLLASRAKKSVQYYTSQPNRTLFDREIQINMLAIQQLAMAAQQLNKKERAKELETFFMKYYDTL